MITDLSRVITASMQRVELSSKATTAVRKKLVAVVIDPLLASMSLDQVRGLRADGHGAVIDEVIREMTLAQLKKVSRKWNPHRKLPKDVVMRDLQIELRDLAAGRAAPATKPERSKRGAAPRDRRTMMAAE